MKEVNYYEEMEKQSLEDQKILDLVRTKVTELAFKEIEDCLNEDGYCYGFEIVGEPEGELEEFDEFKHISVYVNQTTNGGYSGDDFAGTVSIKIGESEYFKFRYSM
jgi:hypothetical protein